MNSTSQSNGVDPPSLPRLVQPFRKVLGVGWMAGLKHRSECPSHLLVSEALLRESQVLPYKKVRSAGLETRPPQKVVKNGEVSGPRRLRKENSADLVVESLSSRVPKFTPSMRYTGICTGAARFDLTIGA